MTERDFQQAVGLHARLCRCEHLYKKDRALPSYHEVEACRARLRGLGIEVPPGDGWDRVPVAFDVDPA